MIVERKREEKRLTASVFGDVMSRVVNNSPMLKKRLLYSNFEGNSFSRKGLMEEDNTRKEYINLKNKSKDIISHINVPGHIVSKKHRFLAASCDDIIHTKD